MKRAPVSRARVSGMSMIELVVGIVVLAIVAAGLATGFSTATRNAPLSKEMHQALQLAQGRMELILYQKQRLGFAGLTGANYDPCVLSGVQEACQKPVDFSVSSCYYTAAASCGFGDPATCFGGDANYKCVRVRVTGPPDGKQLAEVQALVTNY